MNPTSTTFKKFEPVFVNSLAKVPTLIVEQGVNQWTQCCWFHVLRKCSCSLVCNSLLKQWKSKAFQEINIDKVLLYFTFSCEEDKRIILDMSQRSLLAEFLWPRHTAVEAQLKQITTTLIFEKLLNTPKQLWAEEGLTCTTRHIIPQVLPDPWSSVGWASNSICPIYGEICSSRLSRLKFQTMIRWHQPIQVAVRYWLVLIMPVNRGLQ